MESKFNNINAFGNIARDNVLAFQLEHETGYTLTANLDEAENLVILRLLSKQNDVLATASFKASQDPIGGIKDISLDQDQERLVLLLIDDTYLYCDLSPLYALIRSKQDKLRSGINIKTVNGESILEPGNIELVTGMELNYKLSLKQDKLTADNGISLANNHLELLPEYNIFYEILD